MTQRVFISYTKGETEARWVKKASRVSKSDNSKSTCSHPSLTATASEILVKSVDLTIIYPRLLSKCDVNSINPPKVLICKSEASLYKGSYSIAIDFVQSGDEKNTED